jgi:hypothetical protein
MPRSKQHLIDQRSQRDQPLDLDDIENEIANEEIAATELDTE